MQRLFLLAGLAIIALLPACSNAQRGSVIGTAVGIAVGSHVGKGSGRQISRVGFSISGSVIGRRIGGHFDRKDSNQLQQALEYDKTGQQRRWQNNSNDRTYTVKIDRTFNTWKGEPCREFTLQVAWEERIRQTHGVACRKPDGRWKMIK